MATNKTLAELNAAIKTEMQLDPGLISDAERKRFINDCIIDLGGMSSFEKQVTLSVVDGLADLPNDFVDFIALYRDDKIILPATTQYTTSGFISRFPQIEVRPHATESLKLWYTYAPAEVVNDTDTPDLPYGLDNAIIDYAVARAHRKNGNIGLYREYMAAYESKKFEFYQRLTRYENSRVTMILNAEESENVKLDGDIIL